MIDPNLQTDLIGVALLLSALLVQVYRRRKAREDASPNAA
jgi:hypothetical protein